MAIAMYFTLLFDKQLKLYCELIHSKTQSLLERKSQEGSNSSKEGSSALVKVKNCLHSDDMALTGFRLDKSVSDFGSLFGHTYIMTLGYSMLMQIIGLFGSVNLFDGLTSQNIGLIIFGSTVSHLAFDNLGSKCVNFV